MANQFQLQFPPFQSDTFQKVREAYTLIDIHNLQKEIEKLKYSIRSYKGHETRKKNDKNK